MAHLYMVHESQAGIVAESTRSDSARHRAWRPGPSPESGETPSQAVQPRSGRAPRKPHARLFRGRRHMSANEVVGHLREAVHNMYNAEMSACVWFSEILRRELYRTYGYASIHAFASEELDFTPNRIARYLRLIEDLRDLPRTRSALYSGRIEWTKVREIAKVASARNERSWLKCASRCSRRELEALVRRAKRKNDLAARQNDQQPNLQALPLPSTQPGTQVARGEQTPAASISVAGAPAGSPSASAGAVAPDGPPGDLSAAESSVPDGPSGDLGAAESSVPDGFLGSADVFGHGEVQGSEELAADGPVSVLLRLLPVEAAQFEALLANARKQGLFPPNTTKAQIVLQALHAFVASASRPRSIGTHAPAVDERTTGTVTPDAFSPPEDDGIQSSDDNPGRVPNRTDSLPSPGSPLPRGTGSTPYQIVIYKCEACQKATVQTQLGPRRVGRPVLEAAHCDAVLIKPGSRNRSSIPPSVRRKVMVRDGHRCRARGCQNTQFLEVHHIVPRDRGGSNHPDNLVVLCSICHRLWHEKNLDERFLKLTTQ